MRRILDAELSAGALGLDFEARKSKRVQLGNSSPGKQRRQQFHKLESSVLALLGRDTTNPIRRIRVAGKMCRFRQILLRTVSANQWLTEYKSQPSSEPSEAQPYIHTLVLFLLGSLGKLMLRRV
jgi:hypothetical protein